MNKHPTVNANASEYDVLVIGGGINGCGIARDAAGRGFSVCLCEAGDIGSGTSSASTKLVHGGLRYLEHYEFGLVRKALMEREVLWQMAPHIIWPMRFVLPHHKGLRPAWLLRLGLFLYDHLGGRKLLPATKTLALHDDPTGKPLKREYHRAFEYSDCWVEDSRLVVLNARDAADRGASILPRTRAVQARRAGDNWQVTLEDGATGIQCMVTARLVINCAGPWIDEVLKTVFGRNDSHNVRLVRGSHIVIHRKYEHDKSYIFQNSDGRIIFAIPYERDFTLIGTTDVDHGTEMGKPTITHDEEEYLCEMASTYFACPVTSNDIAWSYSGVRPLYNDGATKAQEATRDYVIGEDSETDGSARLINVFGGKITTYRVLSEAILERIEAALGKRGLAWTAGSTLPGGDFPTTGFDELVGELTTRHHGIDEQLLRRLARLYGTRAKMVLANVDSAADLGKCFGKDLFEAEVRYLMSHEWARTAEDVLFRRTKLGIGFAKKDHAALQDFMHQAIQKKSQSMKLGTAG